MLQQERDVFPPVAQRRQQNLHRVDAVEQVLAEHVFVDEILRREIGGADEAHVDRLGFFRAHRNHLAPLDRRQQFALQMERHVADLVEKQRAPGGGAKKADAIFLRVREGAAAMAEQLAFEQLRRQCAQIDAQEHFRRPPRAAMDLARDQFLAGSVLAKDEHVRIGRRRARGSFRTRPASPANCR
jgi:hypothetical protein